VLNFILCGAELEPWARIEETTRFEPANKEEAKKESNEEKNASKL
jgi:hypothetical protein